MSNRKHSLEEQRRKNNLTVLRLGYSWASGHMKDRADFSVCCSLQVGQHAEGAQCTLGPVKLCRAVPPTLFALLACEQRNKVKPRKATKSFVTQTFWAHKCIPFPFGVTDIQFSASTWRQSHIEERDSCAVCSSGSRDVTAKYRTECWHRRSNDR